MNYKVATLSGKCGSEHINNQQEWDNGHGEQPHSVTKDRASVLRCSYQKCKPTSNP
jgi:hypothetical protein